MYIATRPVIIQPQRLGCASDRGANQNRSDLRSRADQENHHQVDEMTATCRLKKSSFFASGFYHDRRGDEVPDQAHRHHVAVLFVSGDTYRSTHHTA